MKLVILDHFRRWWWVWLLCCLVHAAVSYGLCLPEGKFHHAMGSFPLGVFLGAFLLMMDLQRGHARALLTMPVTIRQVARAWWWVAVGIPAAALALITGIVFGVMCVVASVTHRPLPVIDAAAHNWVINLFLLGITFFAATGMPSRQNAAIGWVQQLRGAFFGILYGGSIGGWMLYKDIDLATPAGMAIFSIATLLTILGWFRGETLARERAGMSPSSPAPGKKSSTPSRCAEGHGGLGFLVQSLFTRMTLMGLWVTTFFILIFAFVIDPKFGDHSLQMRQNHASPLDFFGGSASIFTLQIMWIMSFQMAVYAFHIRFLRTLPVSSNRLASVLIFTPLASVSLVLFLSDVLVATVSHTTPFSLASMLRLGVPLQIATMAIIPVLFIWRGMDALAYLLMILLMCGCAFTATFRHGQVSPCVNVVGALSIILGSFIAIKYLLERSSHAYRPRTSQFPGWNWGGMR
jgi:hypothetical protein